MPNEKSLPPGSGDLSPEAYDAVLRNDMASFVRLVFRILHGGQAPEWAPYLDLVAAVLERVVWGEERRLIITMPPRALKSLCVSVALSAFYLGHFPRGEILNISYGNALSSELGEFVRKVMLSPEYKRIFSTRLASDRQPPVLLRTTEGGSRRGTSIDGAATGFGCDLMVFDDPQKALETLSDAIRKSTNVAFENTFLSRANDPKSCRIVVVQQRMHEDDFVGHVQSLGDQWTVINLPAIAEDEEEIPYQTFLGEHVYRRAAGESLHPKRFPTQVYEAIRRASGEAIWSTQYQQRPAPAGGGLIDIGEFKLYGPEEKPLSFERIVQSWDTANKVEEWNDFSVCLTFGLKDGHAFLLDILRKRLTYPDLRAAVVEQAILHKATTILIEDKASGTQLIQELQRAGKSGIVACTPVGDKKMRMSQNTNPIRNGNVHVPVAAAFMSEFNHECVVFPNGRHRDQIDALSQALDHIFAVRVVAQGFLDFYAWELKLAGVPGYENARGPSEEALKYGRGDGSW